MSRRLLTATPSPSTTTPPAATPPPPPGGPWMPIHTDTRENVRVARAATWMLSAYEYATREISLGNLSIPGLLTIRIAIGEIVRFSVEPGSAQAKKLLQLLAQSFVTPLSSPRPRRAKRKAPKSRQSRRKVP